MIDEIRPQRETMLDSKWVGEMRVSSINYHHLFSPMPTNETVVFFLRDNRSVNMGSYDDHDRVVQLLQEEHEATVVSK